MLTRFFMGPTDKASRKWPQVTKGSVVVTYNSSQVVTLQHGKVVLDEITLRYLEISHAALRRSPARFRAIPINGQQFLNENGSSRLDAKMIGHIRFSAS